MPPPDWPIGSWAWLSESRQPCRVLETRPLWGHDVARVWVPEADQVRWTSTDRLSSFDEARLQSESGVAWRAAAGRIADTLAQARLVAPLEGLVTPLPHQIQALSRAVGDNRVRFLLADEVGLGKTIEAGLILKELKARGMVRRTLVVAPAGLTNQWASEMQLHFKEDFRLVKPSDFGAIRRVTGLSESANIWSMYAQVVVSLDAVKPVDGRRGWSREQVERFNRERFLDLVAAEWDLVIIDEAHRIAGSTSQVARHRLGEALSSASPYLLLLSGTPHQGKTEAFRRLMGLLDADAFPPDVPITQERVAPFVIRTEKRTAVDSRGRPLFKKRDVRRVSVEWSEPQREQQALYEAVTQYVRHGYNQAVKEKRTAIGFLMVLMQRLVTSSTRAIRAAMERRLENLELPEGQLSLFQEDIADEWDLRDTPEDLEEALTLRLRGLRNERKEVELLVSAARRCEAQGADVKARALLDTIRDLEQSSGDARLKVLVFTEFVATQTMLAEFLQERGYEVATLNGSMSAELRQQALTDFRTSARILVSTEAGGEGLNLQFCNVVVNYDLPWNPMRLEQRIGRVDRIGQTRDVRAFNFALAGTVELRVQEVLEEKLKVILDEFGVDKLEDVLDSEQGDVDFDQLYIDAIRDPARVEDVTERFLARLRESVREAKEGLEIFGKPAVPDVVAAREIEQHGLPIWTERMTVDWLRSTPGGVAVPDDGGWSLLWPQAPSPIRGTFSRDVADESGLDFLSLEQPRIRNIVDRLHEQPPAGPQGWIRLPDVSADLAGVWSLWRVRLHPGTVRSQRVFPVFVDVDGRQRGPTARMLWDRVVQGSEVGGWTLADRDDRLGGTALMQAAVEVARTLGEDHFRELVRGWEDRLRERRSRAEETIRLREAAARQIAIDSIREGRLRALAEERNRLEQVGAEEGPPVPVLELLLSVGVTSE